VWSSTHGFATGRCWPWNRTRLWRLPAATAAPDPSTAPVASTVAAAECQRLWRRSRRHDGADARGQAAAATARPNQVCRGRCNRVSAAVGDGNRRVMASTRQQLQGRRQPKLQSQPPQATKRRVEAGSPATGEIPACAVSALFSLAVCCCVFHPQLQRYLYCLCWCGHWQQRRWRWQQQQQEQAAAQLAMSGLLLTFSNPRVDEGDWLQRQR